MYLTYANYQNMGGTLDETTFNDFEFEAETTVNWFTFDRLKKFNPEDYPEELERCMYHLIQLIQNKAALEMTYPTDSGSDSGISLGVASWSNDGVSQSFNVLSAKDLLDSTEKVMEQTVSRYLSSVKDSLGRRILYRGIYPDE